MDGISIVDVRQGSKDASAKDLRTKSTDFVQVSIMVYLSMFSTVCNPLIYCMLHNIFTYAVKTSKYLVQEILRMH